MSGRRIAVLGSGAQGLGVGADMVRAGLDVTFIEQWPAHVEAIRERGIEIRMPEETTVTQVRALHLCDVATLRERFDLVFLVTKAYDSRWACELIKPVLADDGLVVGLQNGMSIDDIAAVVGPERTIGAVIEMASNMFEPGIVNRENSPADRLVRRRRPTTRRRGAASRRSGTRCTTRAPSRSPTTSARPSG